MRAGLRGGGASILVSALSSAYGTLLVLASVAFSRIVSASGADGPMVQITLTAVGGAFFGMSLSVGAVVTANSVATVIAGRTRELALLRLLGAAAGTLRRRILVTGLLQSAVGSVVGALIAAAVTAAVLHAAIAAERLPVFEVPLLHAGILVPVLAVVASTAAATWSGSRSVLAVSPIAAAGAVVEQSLAGVRRPRLRLVLGLLVLAVAGAAVALGVAAAYARENGVLYTVGGLLLGGVAMLILAPLLLPRLTHGLGGLLGEGPVRTLAAANALRDPKRSTRAVLGIVIGVALVTMIAVGAGIMSSIVDRHSSDLEPDQLVLVHQVLDVITTVLAVVLGFSAVLSAVGMVDTVSLSVLHRRHEFALLRALGFTAEQVRRLITAEAAAVVAAAMLCGVVVGYVYGTVMMLSVAGEEVWPVLPESVPWAVLGGALGMSVLLTLAASLLPAKRATSVSPVEALALV